MSESGIQSPGVIGKDQKEIYALLTALDKTAIVSATDAKGDIYYTNDRFVEISKYSREELLGQNHRMLKSGYHTPEFYKEMWGTISAGVVWRGEIKNKAKDGSIYWVDSTIVPILGPDLKPERFISVRLPITERKLAEGNILTKNKELEKFNALMIDRELAMVELKKKISKLEQQLSSTGRVQDGFHE